MVKQIALFVAFAFASTVGQATYAIGTCDVTIVNQTCIGGPDDYSYDSNGDTMHAFIRLDYSNSASVAKDVWVKVWWRDNQSNQLNYSYHTYTVPANTTLLTKTETHQFNANMSYSSTYIEIETGFVDNQEYGYEWVAYTNAFWTRE